MVAILSLPIPMPIDGGRGTKHAKAQKWSSQTDSAKTRHGLNLPVPIWARLGLGSGSMFNFHVELCFTTVDTSKFSTKCYKRPAMSESM